MRYIIAALTATAMLLTLTGCTVTVSGIGDDCAVTEERTETVSAEGTRTLRADVQSGFLQIEGVADLKEVQVNATVCARNESDLRQMQLTAGRSGDEVKISTRTVNNGRVDVTLRVPAGLAARINDDSGEITIRQVASVEVDDGSGTIDLSNVGNVLISDDSGDIELRDVGDVEIPDDGSGNINVNEAGKVRIKDDSGEITLRQVAEVTITSDGSGSIDIAGVRGSVVVEHDDSGDIRVDDVSGDFTVREDGSGSISYSRVGRTVAIPRDKH